MIMKCLLIFDLDYESIDISTLVELEQYIDNF